VTDRLPRVTVSIVNYNAGDYLLECLRSLRELRDEADLDIWVVDNASVDQSITKAKSGFPEVTMIENSENRGFGSAQNQVLRQNANEYVLILNPDVRLETGTLRTIVDFARDHPDAGAVTGRVVLPDGQVDLAAHRGFPTPWASFKYFFLRDDSLYHLTGRDLDSVHEVDAISGAFIFTRKSVLDRVGLFDEDYFMYAEDIDLCYRIKRAGFKVFYLPHAAVYHYRGISSGLKSHPAHASAATPETSEQALDAFYASMRIFYGKHLARSYPLPVNLAVYAAIGTRRWLAKKRVGAGVSSER
jgi:GT2 family glycosyltransferase